MDLPHAMAHMCDGALASHTQALQYAADGGADGRLADIRDVISARVRNAPHAWDTWYTTNSAMYFGLDKTGKPIIIVAHGVGPLANPLIVAQAYQKDAKALGFNDELYATVKKAEFEALRDGLYGSQNVFIIDAAPYLYVAKDKNNEYSRKREGKPVDRMTYTLRNLEDPLLMSLLGSADTAPPMWGQMYINIHGKKNDKLSSQMGSDTPSSDRPVLAFEWQISGHLPTLEFWSSNFAAFIVVEIMSHWCNRPDGHVTSFSLQDASRTSAQFIGMRNNKPIKKIHTGIDLDELDELATEIQSKVDQLRLGIKILRMHKAS